MIIDIKDFIEYSRNYQKDKFLEDLCKFLKHKYQDVEFEPNFDEFGIKIIPKSINKVNITNIFEDLSEIGIKFDENGKE